eukprot:scaffold2173_cov416-Prasinococcus_capsulatus_cf.AAC.10
MFATGSPRLLAARMSTPSRPTPNCSINLRDGLKDWLNSNSPNLLINGIATEAVFNASAKVRGSPSTMMEGVSARVALQSLRSHRTTRIRGSDRKASAV